MPKLITALNVSLGILALSTAPLLILQARENAKLKTARDAFQESITRHQINDFGLVELWDFDGDNQVDALGRIDPGTDRAAYFDFVAPGYLAMAKSRKGCLCTQEMDSELRDHLTRMHQASQDLGYLIAQRNFQARRK